MDLGNFNIDENEINAGALSIPLIKGDKGEQGIQGDAFTYNDFTEEQLAGLKGDKGEPGNTGNGIASIEKTGTSGLVDTYTITYTNGDTDTFTITNGEDGTDGTNRS